MASPSSPPSPYQLIDMGPYQQDVADAQQALAANPDSPLAQAALQKAQQALAGQQRANAAITQAQNAADRVQNTADYNAGRLQNAQDQLNLNALKLDIANQTNQLKTLNDNWQKQVQAHQMSVQDWQNQFNMYKTQLDSQIQLYNTESARQTSLNTLAGNLTSDISRSVDAELPHLAAPGTTAAFNGMAAAIQNGGPLPSLPAAQASDIYPGGNPQDMVLNAYQQARQQVGDQAGFGTPPSVPTPVAPGAPPAPIAAPPPAALPTLGSGQCGAPSGPNTAPSIVTSPSLLASPTDSGPQDPNAVGAGSATRPAFGFGRPPRLRVA